MYDQVIQAVQQQEYQTAAHLLKRWQQDSPKDPWFRLALAQYFEATDQLTQAESAYGKLLQMATQAKLLSKARQGMQRIQAILARRREQELAQAQARPEAQAVALLVLMPVAPEARQVAAQGLAKVMQIDPYTARLLVPGKYWRLYRVGKSGELSYFCDRLAAESTPAFWLPLAKLTAIPTFRVEAIQAITPDLSVQCRNPAGQLGTITLPWSDISQWIVGQLPLFESVVDLDPRGKLIRKDTTQDYADVIDLHLHSRSCILRLCDHTYHYRQGVIFPTRSASLDLASSPLTASSYWQAMKAYFKQQIQSSPWTDFIGFGPGSLDLIELLPQFETHIDLIRERGTVWDQSFHLYSCLRFLRHQESLA